MQSACAVLYCYLWPVRLYSIFPHYFTDSALFRNNLLNVKGVLRISLQLLSKTFLILRKIQRYIIVCIHNFSCVVPVILAGFK